EASGQQAHGDREGDSARAQPPGNREQIAGLAPLAANVDVGAEVDRSPDDPAQRDPEQPAGQADDRSFDQEDTADVRVGAADRLHDADLARALQDRHHHRVDDPESGHGKRNGPDQPEDDVEQYEGAPGAAQRVVDR